MNETPPPLRPARAAVFAGVCTGVSAGGHALNSAHAVSPAALAAGFALLFAAAWAMAGSERRLGVLTGWMLWGQGALHLLFTITAPTAGHTSAAHTAATADLDGGGLSATMVAAHAAAGCVSAWWLRQGERGFFDLLGFVGALLAAVLVLPRPVPVPAAPPGGAPRPAADRRPPRSALLRHVHVRRGPPASF
ncbi:hypothetical protein SUDANB121_00210 [Nocardiopsis dassonvillei]|uniref:hypothetical protein n=1 Tax=Nocardiopsis dassonvillei TaxID=2014 RepID=UPI003F54E884